MLQPLISDIFLERRHHAQAHQVWHAAAPQRVMGCNEVASCSGGGDDLVDRLAHVPVEAAVVRCFLQ